MICSGKRISNSILQDLPFLKPFWLRWEPVCCLTLSRKVFRLYLTEWFISGREVLSKCYSGRYVGFSSEVGWSLQLAELRPQLSSIYKSAKLPNSSGLKPCYENVIKAIINQVDTCNDNLSNLWTLLWYFCWNENSLQFSPFQLFSYRYVPVFYFKSDKYKKTFPQLFSYINSCRLISLAWKFKFFPEWLVGRN